MDYYIKIKNELIDNEINKKVKDYSKNKYELEKYYNVGKLLAEAGKHYGDGVLKEYSKRLQRDIGKKYSLTTLKYIRQFYLFSKSHSLSDLLSFTHYRCLLSLKNRYEINYYIEVCKEFSLSVRDLQKRIKSKEYDRLPEETKNKLLNKEENKIEDFIKNPIMIKKPIKYDDINISEKTLQKIILEDIDNFLMELGSGFCYIG